MTGSSARPALTNHIVLVETLRLAVPLWMDQLHQLPEDSQAARIKAWARDAVDPIASRGDTLQFGGKRGEAANVFNHVARGLAALAFQPGGITFAGVHWCANHGQCEDADAWAAANPLPEAPEPNSPPSRRIVDVHLPEVA